MISIIYYRFSKLYPTQNYKYMATSRLPHPIVVEYFSNNRDYIWKRIKHTLISRINSELLEQCKHVKSENRVNQKVQCLIYRIYKNLGHIGLFMEQKQCIRLQEYEKSIKKLEQKLLRQKQQCLKIQRKYENKNYKIQGLQNRVDELVKRLRIQQKQMHESDDQNRKLKQINKNLQQKYNQLKQYNYKKQNKCKIDSQLSQQIQNLKIFHQKQLNTQINTHQQQIRNIQSKHQKQKQFIKIHLNELSSQIYKLNKQNQELALIILSDKRTIQELKYTLKQATSQNISQLSVSSQMSNLHKQLSESQKYIKQLEQELIIMQKIGHRINKYLQMQILGKYISNKDIDYQSLIVENQNWEANHEDAPIVKTRKSFRNASNPQLLQYNADYNQVSTVNQTASNFETSLWQQTLSNKNNCQTTRVINIAQKSSQIDCLSEYKQIMEQQVQVLRVKVRNMQEQQDRLNRDITDRDRCIDELQTSICVHKQREQQLLWKLKDDQQQIYNLRNELNMHKKSNQSILIQLQKYKNGESNSNLLIQQLENKLRIYQNQIKEYKIVIQAKQLQIQKISEEFKDKNLYIQQLQYDKTIGEQLYIQAQAKNGLLYQNIDQLQQQIQSVKQEAIQNQNNYKQMESKLSQLSKQVENKDQIIMQYCTIIDRSCQSAFKIYEYTLNQNILIQNQSKSLQSQNKMLLTINQQLQDNISSLSKTITDLNQDKTQLFCKLAALLRSDKKYSNFYTQTPLIQSLICQACTRKQQKIMEFQSLIGNSSNLNNNRKQNQVNRQTIIKYLVQMCDIGLRQNKRSEILNTLSEVLGMRQQQKKKIQEYNRKNEAKSRFKIQQNTQHGEIGSLQDKNRSLQDKNRSLHSKFFNFLKQ